LGHLEGVHQQKIQKKPCRWLGPSSEGQWRKNQDRQYQTEDPAFTPPIKNFAIHQLWLARLKQPIHKWREGRASGQKQKAGQ
jgi:hypothetical protein